MLKFDNWKLTAEGDVFDARQHDNLTARLEVIGDLPEEWGWSMLMQKGDNMDEIPLDPMEGGVGYTLDANHLSQSGLCSLQLKGTRGSEVKHTNIISAYIPSSLSGSGEWPAAPSEYMMVVTLSEASEDFPLDLQASHSAEEIIAQMQRGWDVVMLADIEEDETKLAMELRPFAYYIIPDEDGKISIVIFSGSMLTGDGFVSALFGVIDAVAADGSESVKGAADGTVLSENLVYSVNGQTGNVTLTADDLGAVTYSQMAGEVQAEVESQFLAAKNAGELTGPQGDAGTVFVPTVDEETGMISWENDGGLDNPAPANIKGPQGKPFTYEDFTEEQLEDLTGPQGDPGSPGKDNLPNVSAVEGTEVTLTLDNNVEYQCAEALTALTIEGFTPAKDGKVSMWALQFTAGDEITVTVPDTVKWAIAEPVFTAGVTYWLSFVPLITGDILGVWVSNE